MTFTGDTYTYVLNRANIGYEQDYCQKKPGLDVTGWKPNLHKGDTSTIKYIISEQGKKKSLFLISCKPHYSLSTINEFWGETAIFSKLV